MIRDTFDFAAAAVAHALGEEVLYNGRPIMVVFGAGFTLVESGEVRLSSSRPEISVRLDDLVAAPVAGDRVEVRGVEYDVATVRPDTENVSATLTLKRPR